MQKTFLAHRGLLVQREHIVEVLKVLKEPKAAKVFKELLEHKEYEVLLELKEQ
jgi:hypothetical protein